MISRITDPQGLEKIPISNLLTLAESLSIDDHRQLKDYRPFDGVVKVAPLRALSALRMVGRKGEHPIQFWRSLMSNWPEASTPRLSLLLGHTVARLPASVFAVLNHAISSWTNKFVEGLIRHDRPSGLAVFDAIVASFASAGDEIQRSSIIKTSVAGVTKIESEYSIMKALNSPGGDLALVLIHLLNEPKRRRPMPTYIGTRLDLLLKLPAPARAVPPRLSPGNFGGWSIGIRSGSIISSRCSIQNIRCLRLSGTVSPRITTG